ncbi:glycoside hydrolase family 30 beta sandwich domain-containing protein [Roseateles sp. BYS78W]|uniref:Glycoside hydrolase family 30 beta sandwich domain-containing protein n=1 Tax=Pelomonas candidula TaxID=3299025 RepID=A0ABW7HAR8_9BURK
MRAAAAAVLLGLLATGCGGGGGGGSATATPTTPPTASLATPDISWPDPAAIGWGTALSAAQLNAKSGVAGSFAYSPAAGSKPEVGTQTLTVTFTPQDGSRYATTTATRTLRIDKAAPAVRWDTPAAVAQGATLTPALLGTAPRALYGVQGTADAASFQTADGRTLAAATASAGSVVLQARFMPQDSAHYQPAWVSTLLTVKPAATPASIDFTATRQVIDGFGGSAAWYYTTMSQTRLDTLFGTQLPDSLGLSILRLRIAPAAWNATTQTADTSAWTAELANGTAAQARGARVFSSSWSPPASLKIVNADRTDPLWSGRLDPAQYGAYAQYLNAYIRYAATRGVNLAAISPQNEPDWDPTNYESCLWNADELKAWLGTYGAAAVAGTSTRLIAPESLNFSPTTTEALLADDKAAQNIAIIGGHLYGGVPQFSAEAARQGKAVWMTEHFLDSVNKSSTGTAWTTSIDDALAIAREIHDGMTLGQYNAYVHWWLVNSDDNKPTGLVDNANKPNHFGLGLKHFAYFVRPGFTRVDATAQPLDGVSLSAYGGTGGQAVIVLINDGSVDRTLSVAVAGRSPAAWTPYRTSATESFAKLTNLAASAGSFSVTLPAKSITTVVNTDTP